MGTQSTAWAVVLAAGPGRRLSSLTTDTGGRVVPKQFCALARGPSLLRRTLTRLARVVDPDRTLVVVSSAHRAWWQAELADIPPKNVVIQPCDRGTACGVLLPLITILHRDPEARVLVSPSDHYVRNEDTLVRSMTRALTCVEERPERLLVLGIGADHAETEYGWITADPEGEGPVREVTSFVEKPDAERARELFDDGALWSSFIFMATAKTLMTRYRRSLGWLVDRFDLAFEFSGGTRRDVIDQLYDGLPSVDFSRQMMQRDDNSFSVLAVPPCGWTDLGSPERVIECVRSHNCPFMEDARSMSSQARGTGSRPVGRQRELPLGLPDLAEAAVRAIEHEARGRGARTHHLAWAAPTRRPPGSADDTASRGSRPRARSA